MKKHTIFNAIVALILCLTPLSNLFAQHSTFLDVEDARQRGYYNRPYLRYEAEPGLSQKGGNATYLSQTFDQREIQSEASNQQAIQLLDINDYVEWVNTEDADGVVIRFSIPDNIAGTGTTGIVSLYVDGVFVQDIELNSRWAWQYFFAGTSSYAHNVPELGRYPRMRFDEKRVKLENKILQGSTFRLVKKDQGAGAYTIDFVELEEVPLKVEKPEGENVVEYSGDGSDLVNFVADNAGKTIYIPEGEYDIPIRLSIVGDNTKLIGAGMWYTQLHFTANPSNVSNNPYAVIGYNARGIESIANNIELSGFYMTTENDRRYANYTDSGRQVGKGFNGTFGVNSKISDVWVTHFECGAWIEASTNLQVKNARFRNNYADGINLARGSKDAVVEYCSFRNNGDDDMASWSRSNTATENNTFRYNTSENNWRAAGIGFFGGKQNKAFNILVVDPIEDGIRINDEYNAAPFSDEGYFEIRNISIYRAGAKAGPRGEAGNLWGNRAAAIYLSSAAGKYDVRNFFFSDIDIYDSKGNAIMIMGNANGNIFMKDVHINRAAISDSGNSWLYYGLFFQASGYNNFFCIDFANMGDIPKNNTVPARGFILNSNCDEEAISVRVNQTIDLKYFIPENFAENVNFSLLSGEENISLDEQGLILGLTEGTAQVKVTDIDNELNNITYTVIVKDIAVTGLSMIEEVTVFVTDTYKLIPVIEPENATNKNIIWSNSNTNVIQLFSGTLMANASGESVITATTADGRYTATCIVTVTPSSGVVDAATNDLSIVAYDNTIQISGCSDDEIISVYNLFGVKVFSQQLTEKTSKIVHELHKGVYLVVAEKAQVKQKVIIN